MIFDTHAHYYDDAFDADRDALLSALPGKGVALVVCLQILGNALRDAMDPRWGARGN